MGNANGQNVPPKQAKTTKASRERNLTCECSIINTNYMQTTKACCRAYIEMIYFYSYTIFGWKYIRNIYDDVREIHCYYIETKSQRCENISNWNIEPIAPRLLSEQKIWRGSKRKKAALISITIKIVDLYWISSVFIRVEWAREKRFLCSVVKWKIKYKFLCEQLFECRKNKKYRR